MSDITHALLRAAGLLLLDGAIVLVMLGGVLILVMLVGVIVSGT
jgi:hypothetical protein